MKDPIEVLTAGCRDWLVANRPAGLPVSITVNGKAVPVSIKALVTDKVAATRPVVLFEAAVSGQPHRHAFTVRMRVRLLVQTDETDGSASSTWLKAVADALEAGFAGVQAELQLGGYWLTRWRPRGVSVQEQGERGHERYQDVEVSLRKGFPILQELVDLGEGMHVGWYVSPSMATKRGDDFFFGGIKRNKAIVAMRMDSDGAVTRKEDLYTSPTDDDHNQLVLLPDGRNSNLIGAQCDHADEASNEIRFYVSTTGAVEDLTLKATIAADAPTYVQLHRSGDAVYLISRDRDNHETDWRLYYCADYTVATPTFAETPLGVGHYCVTAPAMDGSGFWLLGAPLPLLPGPAVSGADITQPRVWVQNLNEPVFVRYSDGAVLVHGEVELADIRAQAQEINFQGRNLCPYSDNFRVGAGLWSATNVGSAINDNDVDRWGQVGTGAGLGVYRLKANGGSGTHNTKQSGHSATAGQKQTLSLYAKAGDLSGVRLYGALNSAAGGLHPNAQFDLAAGVVHASENLGAGGSAYVVDVGNDWYRCVLEYVPALTVADTHVQISMQDADFNNSFDADDSYILIQGVQHEVGGLTNYSGNALGVRNATNVPKILHAAPEGDGLRPIKIRQVVSTHLEILFAQYKGFSGSNAGNEADCHYYYARYNLSTYEVEGLEKIDVIGRGTGSLDSRAGGADVLGVRRVVYAQNDLNGAGKNYLMYWEPHGYHVKLQESADYAMRPQSVLVHDAETATVDGDHFSLLEGDYVDDKDWNTQTKLKKVL